MSPSTFRAVTRMLRGGKGVYAYTTHVSFQLEFKLIDLKRNLSKNMNNDTTINVLVKALSTLLFNTLFNTIRFYSSVRMTPLSKLMN